MLEATLSLTKGRRWRSLGEGGSRERQRAFGEGWRRERDSNPRYGFPYSGFQDRLFQPLTHPSALARQCGNGAMRAMRQSNASRLRHCLDCPLPHCLIAQAFNNSRPPMYGRSASGITTDPSCLLKVLENRDQRAADGEAGAVQRVRELRLAGAVGRKRICARRAWNASQLLQDEISRYVVLARQPDLDVVGLRRREAHVAGAEQHAAIRQVRAARAPSRRRA